jgi:dTDP-4-dehydrorhamnose reductase
MLRWAGLDVDRKDTTARRAADGPVVVVGAAGQLGEVIAALLSQTWQTIAWTRRDIDLRDGTKVHAAIADARPWAVVNCAGYNEVDEAEEQPAVALDANAFAVRSLASAAAETGAVLVHYSSDFVFDGASTRPYREEDRPNPRGVYAASKLLGEWFAADAARHYVLRVESLFGGLTRRKGSFEKIIRSLEAGEPPRAFTDRVVSPSYVWDVAAATASLLRSQPASGLYHCVNSGAATWFEVAEEARRQLGARVAIEAITMKDAGQLRAPRPAYCALSNDKLRAAGIDMPTWQDALSRDLQARRTPGASSRAITEKIQ